MNGTRHTIIHVDDNETELYLGKQILQTFYKVFSAMDAETLFETLEHVTPDLILLDVMMPVMSGHDIIKILKSDSRYKDIPVIFATGMDGDEDKIKGLELGAADYITKPLKAPLLLKRISKEISIVQQTKKLLQYNAELNSTVHKKTAEVVGLQNTILSTIADLVELRDNFTGEHITRTQHYLQLLVEKMVSSGVYHEVVSGWDVPFLVMSSQLHDIGKVGIPDIILNKNGKLTPEEFEIIKGHVNIGVAAIEKIISHTQEHAFLRHALYIIGTHHEKWDGSGYILGLKHEDIPLEGRLMAIVDVYDALVSIRPYKKAFSHEEACKIIIDGSGTHFDPQLVDVFLNIHESFANFQMK